jgi:hypothetical protein
VRAAGVFFSFAQVQKKKKKKEKKNKTSALSVPRGSSPAAPPASAVAAELPEPCCAGRRRLWPCTRARGAGVSGDAGSPSTRPPGPEFSQVPGNRVRENSLLWCFEYPRWKCRAEQVMGVSLHAFSQASWSACWGFGLLLNVLCWR